MAPRFLSIKPKVPIPATLEKFVEYITTSMNMHDFLKCISRLSDKHFNRPGVLQSKINQLQGYWRLGVYNAYTPSSCSSSSSSPNILDDNHLNRGLSSSSTSTDLRKPTGTNHPHGLQDTTSLDLGYCKIEVNYEHPKAGSQSIFVVSVTLRVGGKTFILIPKIQRETCHDDFISLITARIDDQLKDKLSNPEWNNPKDIESAFNPYNDWILYTEDSGTAGPILDTDPTSAVNTFIDPSIPQSEWMR